MITIEDDNAFELGRGPAFDAPVPDGGYQWWYIDAVSEDRQTALTIIFFVGSVFSPYYFRARKPTGVADPNLHCAVNVALYRTGARKTWAFTEHRGAEVKRTEAQFCLGASRIWWVLDFDRGHHLCVELDEGTKAIGVPFARRRIRGRVRLWPDELFGPRIELDDEGAHRWFPVAPHARVEVELEQPDLKFTGSGYHDMNSGDAPLEHAFKGWNWSRAELGSDTAILYDVTLKNGRERTRGWRFSPRKTAGVGAPKIHALDTGPTIELPRTRWGVPRSVRCDEGGRPTVRQTLEDTPFYSRNLIETTLAGVDTFAVHESLDMARFCDPKVQFLLPFRVRRKD